MDKYCVYILECCDSSYYVGVTNDVLLRVKQHQSRNKEYSYTASRLPVKLVYVEEFKYIDKAIKREKQLKQWSRKKKEALIKGDSELLKRSAMSDKAIAIMLRQGALKPLQPQHDNLQKYDCQADCLP